MLLTSGSSACHRPDGVSSFSFARHGSGTFPSHGAAYGHMSRASVPCMSTATSHVHHTWHRTSGPASTRWARSTLRSAHMCHAGHGSSGPDSTSSNAARVNDTMYAPEADKVAIVVSETQAFTPMGWDQGYSSCSCIRAIHVTG